MVDLSDVLNRSRALCEQQNSSVFAIKDSIPRLERALEQIDGESRRLVPKLSQSSSTRQKENALRLLASYGFETDRMERSLQSIALRDAFEPLHGTPDTDIGSFLHSQAQFFISKAIETTIRGATNLSLSALSSSIETEWESSKRDLVAVTPLISHSEKPHQKRYSSSSAALFASPFRQPRAARLSTSLELSHASSDPPSIYYPVIRRIVHERSSPNSSPPVATMMDDELLVNLAPRGDPLLAQRSIQHLHAVFNALRYITGEPASAPLPASFEKMSTQTLQRQVCLGAYRYLCLQYREDKMKREVELRPVEARRGGVPGVRADVRAFLNLVFDRGLPEQLSNGPMFDGMPVWAFVFYCLRAGYLQEAMQLVEECISGGCTDGPLRLFSECLRSYCESGEKRSLPDHLLERLIQEYRVSVKDGVDPYRRVCYIVISRVDPSKGEAISLANSDYGLLFYSIEDYLWLRLSIARLEGDDPLPASLSTYDLSVKEIGEEVRNFGPGHFNANGDTPMFYALVLVLSGEFKEAIEYLSEKGRALTEAVHISYIMYHYGMTRDGSNDGTLDEMDSSDGFFNVDYASLMWEYASRLCKNDSAAAVLYIFSLRDHMLRRELLKKLLVEFQAIDSVIGRNGHDGVLSMLWKREEGNGDLEREGWRTIVVEAAEEAEKRGEREKALKLYGIGGLTSKIAEIHLKRLSGEVSFRGSPKRERIIRDANQFLSTCEDNCAGSVSDKVLNSLRALITMGSFFDLRWAEKYEEAVGVLEKMPIVPKNEGEVVSKVSELGFGSRVWSNEIVEKVPELIVGAMEVLTALYNKKSTSSLERAKLRQWARNLVNLCGMMRNLSADMSARLVGLEVLMT